MGGASFVVSESARSLSSAFLHQALLHRLIHSNNFASHPVTFSTITRNLPRSRNSTSAWLSRDRADMWLAPLLDSASGHLLVPKLICTHPSPQPHKLRPARTNPYSSLRSTIRWSSTWRR